MSLSYGPNGRVGVIVPSGNICSEPDLSALLHEGVAIHVTRLQLTSSNVEDILDMVGRVESAASLLADFGPDLVLFHCTGASALATGNVAAQISRTAGCPATTTADAIVAGLHALGVNRPALLGPYPTVVNAGEVEFFARFGIAVAASVALDLQPITTWAQRSEQFWLDQACASFAAAPEADSIVISCTNIRALGAIEQIEDRCQVPVVTSNQAAIWQVLDMLNLDMPAINHYGRLMDRNPVPPHTVRFTGAGAPLAPMTDSRT
jgi:maleate isomerase